MVVAKRRIEGSFSPGLSARAVSLVRIAVITAAVRPTVSSVMSRSLKHMGVGGHTVRFEL
ncbi:hypothetical protein MEX01_11310 [Methylorubrum extorquens]|nr:hypothetical protein MEX01_11310 [Methylorubrum extorquens]